MLSIFKTEVGHLNSQDAELQSQIAAIQAQIAANQERRSLLDRSESVVSDAIQVLESVIRDVVSQAPDAIASLKLGIKSAVTGLLNGGGNEPNDGETPGKGITSILESPEPADQLASNFQNEVETRGIPKLEPLPMLIFNG